MKEPIMNSRKNVEVVLEVFGAIERRDSQRLLELFHPDVELHWPLSLPYGGTSRGPKAEGPTWSETWGPLQPTEAERSMDPRVVAASEEEVVVLWRQRGVTQAGDRFDGPVLSIYQVLEGRLARGQMFYFDTAALVSFLAKAKDQSTAPTRMVLKP
jgi:ketosteroid isomerase-like protein